MMSYVGNSLRCCQVGKNQIAISKMERLECVHISRAYYRAHFNNIDRSAHVLQPFCPIEVGTFFLENYANILYHFCINL